ncbi:MAG: xanthine dehydrogenase family protein molybdopterin-binding subunit, partial [Sphingomonas sp.]
MRFDDPAGPNLIDGLRSIGRPEPRVEGKLKVTGTAHYAADRQIALDQAYGYILGAQIAKGRITAMRVADARETPGVIAVLAADDYSPFPSGHMNTASLFGGADVAHYHQPIALVVAETFEQARAASALIQVDYEHEVGAYSLAEAARGAPLRAIGKAGDQSAPIHRVGDFDGAFASAPVTVDETYTTPDQTHAMIEPHATVAVWEGHRLTVWTSTQLVHESQADLANSLGIPREDVHLESPYIGGGFGAKLFIRADLLLAALGARESGRAVKLTLQRPLIANNTTHRPATIQRVRLGATPAGVLTALGHASTSGNLPGGMPEPAVALSKLLYGAPNREIEMRLAVLDLPEGSAMRAPGEAPGLMAFEIAMDELSEKLGMDPVELRIINDTQVDPANSERLFSERHLVECLRVGAARFGWSQRPAGPRQRREGNALIGMGVAVGMRNNQLVKSAARIRLERNARLTVETDMTDIGTGSYTILAQTAAEMMGVPVSQVDVRLGRSDFPISAGSGGQWGANNATAGLYAACLRLRDMVSTRLGFDPATAHFADGLVRDGNRSCTFEEA